MSAAVLVQRSVQYLFTSLAHTHLLLTGNDTADFIAALWRYALYWVPSGWCNCYYYCGAGVRNQV